MSENNDQNNQNEELERAKPESYEVDVDKLTSPIAKTLVGHKWVQRGPYLVCTSCELEHGVYVGMDKRLVGFDEEGKPIVKRV